METYRLSSNLRYDNTPPLYLILLHSAFILIGKKEGDYRALGDSMNR